MKPVRRVWLCCTVIVLVCGCTSEIDGTRVPVKVEIARTASGYALLRGGEPYRIRGAGMVRDDIERFAAHGGNSIRTWSTNHDGQDTMALLDSAQAHSVTVALGLAIKPERHGFDYSDPGAVSAQLGRMRAEVRRYRDHPALLMWVIGNELNHSYTNPVVYDAVNDVAVMIRELDPNHPTTTAVSGFKPDVIAEIRRRAPDLDFISFQMYGSIFALPERLAQSGFEAPFMVTEWGTIGYWEVEKSAWGAPLELTSSEKADVFRRAYEEVLAPLEGQLIGNYGFFWGQKQERTPTWFGMLTEEGHETEAVDVMHYLWTGQWPGNRTPRVRALTIDGRNGRSGIVLLAGQAYRAEFQVVDPEGESLEYLWQLRPESVATSGGGDYEAPIASMDGYLMNPDAASTVLRVPDPGAYRLFVYAADGHGHVAHANAPFLVAQ